MIMVQILDHIIGIKHNDSPSHERTSLSERKRKFFCTHCKMHGNETERCWKLHPELRSKKGKDLVQPNAREERGGKEDSQQS